MVATEKLSVGVCLEHENGMLREFSVSEWLKGWTLQISFITRL